MPAYLSHAIMSEQLYNESSKDQNLFKIPISKSELRGFSLGNDLSLISKRLTLDPQNNHTKEFFLSMIKYIKENNLIENPHIISLLYGHMSHYFLDINCHPLIYYIEFGCNQIGLIPPHDLVEGYLSSYLSEKILNKDIMDINQTYFNQINLHDKEIVNLLNYVYGNLYGDYQIIKTYKHVLNLFTILEKSIKNKLLTKEKIIKLLKFQEFLHQNNLTKEEINNENHYIYRHPLTGKTHSESFLELYLKSIEMTKEAINITNKYLYGNKPISNLEQVFVNLSYDTGVDCSLGRNFVHTRKRVKK